VKPRRGKAPGTMDFFPIPEDIFQSLCMDFLQLEPCIGHDGKEYDYAFVIVCRLSGFITAFPCKKAGLTAKDLAYIFLERCVPIMGIPTEIVSDQDHLISSKIFSTLCDLLGIEQHYSIIYRPKGNGRAEAAVKAVVNVLRTFLAENKKPWVDILPWAVFQHNILPGIILPHSPYRIVFGREPPLPGDIPPNKPRHRNISCEEWFTQLENIRKEVQDQIIGTHTKIRNRYISEHRTPEYEAGDKVWVKNTKQRTQHSKLDPLWTGPCEILERMGNTGRYKVGLPTGIESVHMDCFKPYMATPSGKAIPFLYYKPRKDLPETDEYIVEKILEHKIEKGVPLWKVRWKGYGPEEDSWEPAKSFVGFIQQDWKKWNKQHGVNIPLEDL
jgi:transposase InsO family protein